MTQPSSQSTIRQLQTQIRILEQALDRLEVGVVVTDQNGHVNHINQLVLAELNKTTAQILHQPISELFNAVTNSDIERLLATPERAQPRLHQFDLKTRSGQVIPALVRIRPLHDKAEQVVGFVWSMMVAGSTHLDFQGSQAMIIQAINKTASILLKSTKLWEKIEEVLALLGTAVGVSRVYLFQNSLQGSDLVTSQRYEWVDPSQASSVSNEELSNISFQQGGLERWYQLLSHNKVIHGLVESFPESEQQLLLDQNIKSLVVVPLNVEEHGWWGFIGFDDCVDKRVWKVAELDLLRTAADVIGAAIYRQDKDRELHDISVRLQQQNEELEKINQLMVGREIKMIELKKKLQASKLNKDQSVA